MIKLIIFLTIPIEVHIIYDYDSSKVTSSIFVDYSKAFDTIDHKILLKKLKLYGLGNHCLNWFGNYLNNRTQVVKINRHIVSKPQSVRSGVPQGSILGPFFFIVYINDLIYELKDCKVSITLYADDTILYTGHEDIYKAYAENLLAMTVLYDWCNQNRLSINLNKTKHMAIGKDCKNDLAIPSIKLNGLKNENVHDYNYLGVIIDDKLSFDDMVDAKYKKINVRIHQLGKLRKYVNSEIAQVIYKQMILPLFEYADFMVESARKPKIDKLEKLQEKGIRYVDNGYSFQCRY